MKLLKRVAITIFMALLLPLVGFLLGLVVALNQGIFHGWDEGAEDPPSKPKPRRPTSF